MTEGVTRLKELPFETENQPLVDLDRRVQHALRRVAALEERKYAQNAHNQETMQLIGQLFEKVGTRERFMHHVADTIADALQEAGVQKNDGIAQSVVAYMLKTIDGQLRENQNKLADALYPITGSMVKRYFAHAVKQLIGGLNRRLECNFLMLQIRSVISGKSVAELSISKSQHLKVEGIFILQRHGGKPLACWADNDPGMQTSDAASEIYRVATENLQINNNQLLSFEHNDATVFVRSSSFYIVAVKCSGVVPSGLNSSLKQEFLSLLERINLRNGYATPATCPIVHQHELTRFAVGLEEKAAAIYAKNERAGLPFRPLKVLLSMFLMAVFSGLVWWGYVTVERQRVEKTVQDIVAGTSELQGYPINLDVGYRGEDVRIGGLAPNEEVVNRLRNRLGHALPHANVVANITVPPNFETILDKRLLAGMKSQIAAIETEAKRRSLRQALQRTGARLLQAKLELQQLRSKFKTGLQGKALAAIEAAIERIESSIDTYLTIVKATSHDLASLQNLNVPLRNLSETINAVTDQIVALANSAVQPAASSSMDFIALNSADVTVASEYLEAQSQRLMSIALALSRILYVRSLTPTPASQPN